MDLRLAGDVALATAGELDVLVARNDLLDGARVLATRLPHIDGKDQCVTPWHIVEDDLDRRVRVDATIPI